MIGEFIKKSGTYRGRVWVFMAQGAAPGEPYWREYSGQGLLRRAKAGQLPHYASLQYVENEASYPKDGVRAIRSITRVWKYRGTIFIERANDEFWAVDAERPT